MTWAQVLLRWQLQHGHVVIPKSTHAARMRENAAITDVVLDDRQMAAIDALDDPSFPAINPERY